MDLDQKVGVLEHLRERPAWIIVPVVMAVAALLSLGALHMRRWGARAPSFAEARCDSLYHQARTKAESTMVDLMPAIPPGLNADSPSQPNTLPICVNVRMNAPIWRDMERRAAERRKSSP